VSALTAGESKKIAAKAEKRSKDSVGVTMDVTFFQWCDEKMIPMPVSTHTLVLSPINKDMGCLRVKG